MARIMMATAVALVCLLGGQALSSIASAKKRNVPAQVKVTATIDSANVVDNSPAGDSQGDVLVFTQKLTNSSGRPIGTANAYCVRTVVGQARQCQGTFDLPKGQVFVSGPDPEYEQVKVHPLAIVGGTRAYRNARGHVTLRHVSPTEDRDTFTFVR